MRSPAPVPPPPSTTSPRPCAATSPTAATTSAIPISSKCPSAALLDPAYTRKAPRLHRPGPRHAAATLSIPGALAQPVESTETTHYSIVDAEGNAVAVTYTLNGGYGSGVTVPGLGFLLNNEMDDFAAKPGAAQHVRPDPGRGQRHPARQAARSPP